MSSDQPRRRLITRNLRLAYKDVTAEPLPVTFLRLLRRMDGEDDDLDPGVGAEPPPRPRGGPQSSAAEAQTPAEEDRSDDEAAQAPHRFSGTSRL